MGPSISFDESGGSRDDGTFPLTLLQNVSSLAMSWGKKTLTVAPVLLLEKLESSRFPPQVFCDEG